MKRILVLFSFFMISINTYASETCLLSDIRHEQGNLIKDNRKICYSKEKVTITSEDGTILFQDKVRNITGSVNYMILDAEKKLISIRLSDKANEEGHIGHVLLGIIGEATYFIKTIL